MRKLLNYIPLTSFILILGTSLLLSSYARVQEQEKGIIRSNNFAQQLATSLEILSADRTRALNNLVESWPMNLSDPREWFIQEANTVTRMLPGIADFILSDTNGEIKSVLNKKNKDLIGNSLNNLGLIDFSVKDGISSAILTRNYNHYVTLSIPVKINDAYVWNVIALFDTREMLDALTSDFEERQINVDVMDNDQRIFSLGTITDDVPHGEFLSKFAKRNWKIRTQSHEGINNLPYVIVLLGIFLSVVSYSGLVAVLKREIKIKQLQSLYQSAADASLDGLLLFIVTKGLTKTKFKLFSLNNVASRMFKKITLVPHYTGMVSLSNHIGYSELEDSCLNVYQNGEPFSHIFRTHERMSPVSWLKIQIVKTESGVALTLHDVSREQDLQQKIAFHAHHDPLTGLLNRYAFSQELQRLSGKETTAFLCYLDLDRFKQVNDSCGHVAGDELLKNVAQLLSGSLRKKDLLARVGGDEFCLIIKDKTREQVEILLDRLLKLLSDFRFSWDEQTFIVGASIGVLELSDAYHLDTSDIIKAADAGCYVAKKAGRNQYFFVDDKTVEFRHVEKERYFMNVIRRALVDDKFNLYAQPIVPLSREEMLHIEILIRLRGEDNEEISPSVFIPLAERQGMMREIDQWVISRVLEELKNYPEYLNRLHKCAINISAVSLCDLSFLPWLVKKIVFSGVPGHKLCFEITETAAITNLSQAQRFISELRQLGCHFSLDDFGVGMSSFGSLKTLDVDYVKIDGSFVRNMKKDASDAALVKAMTDIVHSMKKEVIAEFVSDHDTCTLLKEFGVEYGQGFGLAMPMPWSTLSTNSNDSE